MSGDALETQVPPDSNARDEELREDELSSAGEIDNELSPRSRAIHNYKNLPATIKRKVKALKKLQFNTFKVEAEYQKELHDLEQRYAAKFDPFLLKRYEILTGKVEPTDEECDWQSDVEENGNDDDVNQVASEVEQKVNIKNDTAAATTTNGDIVPTLSGNTNHDITTTNNSAIDGNAKGIPDFWLTVFQNVDMLSGLIQPNDIPILKHLEDIRCVFLNADDTPVNKPGFRLVFYFTPNNGYFTDNILTKDYFLEFDVPTESPLDYDGPEIVQSKGCVIHWKKDKNVTVKLMKKTQKHKNKNEKRVITKTVKTDSFFNFFSPPEDGALPELNISDPDADPEELKQIDFELGQFLRVNVLPRAVLYFTGEGIEEDEFDEDDEDDEDEDDEDDDEVDDDEDIPVHRLHNANATRANRGNNAASRRGGSHAVSGANPPADCKQQ